MGQFMGWKSYDLKVRCESCGEVGHREDMENHGFYCNGETTATSWKKRSARVKLTEEPYPEAEIECEDCGQVWEDTEDPTCTCEEEDEE